MAGHARNSPTIDWKLTLLLHPRAAL